VKLPISDFVNQNKRQRDHQGEVANLPLPLSSDMQGRSQRKNEKGGRQENPQPRSLFFATALFGNPTNEGDYGEEDYGVSQKNGSFDRAPRWGVGYAPEKS